MIPLGVLEQQGGVVATDDFILTMRTTSASETITIPLKSFGGVDPDVVIDWGDGSPEETVSGGTTEPSHVYAVAGDYDISIVGDAGNLEFGNTAADRTKLIAVSGQGGALQTRGTVGTFYGCSNLESFEGAGLALVDTSFLLRRGWWNCSSLTSWSPPTNYDTAVFTNLLRTFSGLTSTLTMDLTNFNTGSVTSMESCFRNSTGLTVTGLDTWDVTSLNIGLSFMNGCTPMSVADYDAVLVAWEAQAVNNSVNIHFGGCQYTSGSAADTARTALATDHLWTITDGGSV